MDNKEEKPVFTEEEVRLLNEFQQAGKYHPFTCCGTTSDGEKCDRSKQPNDGELIATTSGWICPCGKYTQNWAHASMMGK